MKAVCVQNQNAKKVLDFLKPKFLLKNFLIIKQDSKMFIPVIDSFDISNTIIQNIAFVVENIEFKEKPKKSQNPKNFKKEIMKILTEKEKKSIKPTYELLGKIAILEIDEVLNPKMFEIGKILLECNPKVNTVVKKRGSHEGEFRIQKYDYICGEETMITKHKENNCVINIEIDKMYFSSKSASERKRIFSQIKTNEKVLVMFSGCGPFVCTIAKNSPAQKVVGIELNPDAHQYSLLNIKENQIENIVDLYLGDVRQICPELKENDQYFDRIVMPLPKTAEEFLPDAFIVAKNSTIIHLYDFVELANFPQNVIQKIEFFCSKFGSEI
ncbi:tRNA (guanine(37)-n1)-methyltransferase [Anaeramoeba ignava]|uniref:tRNA (Guanine(37)-n1)-methyltransferase n=1 Tax=Anaeramoeba ignava TaxID=1746090 RepID=A0A9Q0R668_ANAIG|nr:tRNA (guanine(37)-n1)-methyltransferase [Anaeramoeba ignava]